MIANIVLVNLHRKKHKYTTDAQNLNFYTKLSKNYIIKFHLEEAGKA